MAGRDLGPSEKAQRYAGWAQNGAERPQNGAWPSQGPTQLSSISRAFSKTEVCEGGLAFTNTYSLHNITRNGPRKDQDILVSKTATTRGDVGRKGKEQGHAKFDNRKEAKYKQRGSSGGSHESATKRQRQQEKEATKRSNRVTASRLQPQHNTASEWQNSIPLLCACDSAFMMATYSQGFQVRPSLLVLLEVGAVVSVTVLSGQAGRVVPSLWCCDGVLVELGRRMECWGRSEEQQGKL